MTRALLRRCVFSINYDFNKSSRRVESSVRSLMAVTVLDYYCRAYAWRNHHWKLSTRVRRSLYLVSMISAHLRDGYGQNVSRNPFESTRFVSVNDLRGKDSCARRKIRGNIFKRTDRYRQNNGAINVPNTVIYYDIPCSVAVRGNQDLYEHHELQRKRETK